ncbi:hypothetical protein ACFVTY_30720 [Streptomyces sp. NPDC058067]|uniref:hypothetical protein n=1 Tax=Streptomyces sp. NPDC058067 TaxID=3346324 RepID=UPI0036F0EDDA
MASDEKRGKDRADELQKLIDELTSGAAPDAPAPTGPRGESLRDAVHRRMGELADETKAERSDTKAEQKGAEEAPEPDGDSS